MLLHATFPNVNFAWICFWPDPAADHLLD